MGSFEYLWITAERILVGNGVSKQHWCIVLHRIRNFSSRIVHDRILAILLIFSFTAALFAMNLA